jgi:GNAT superfamily N-acetyltransferase
MGKISVRVLTLDQIGPDGLRSLFADPHKYIAMCDATWAKMIRANPYAQGSDVAMILALDDETVVGRLGFHAATASVSGGKGVGGQPSRIHWMDGYFLHKDYVTTGVGGLIMLQAAARCKSILACGGPSEAAQKLYKAAGMKEIGPLRRWVYFLTGVGPARKVFKAGPLASIAAPFAGVALRAFYAIKRRGARPSCTLVPVDRFDDTTIDNLYANFPLPHFPRSAATLNWALESRAIRPFMIHKGQQIVGYALLKRCALDATQHGLGRLTVGVLHDFFLAEATPDNKRDLVLLTIDHFRRDGAPRPGEDGGPRIDVVEVQALDPQLDAICKSLGMVHVGGLRVLFKPPPGVKLPEDGRWFLTASSGDMLLMPP